MLFSCRGESELCCMEVVIRDKKLLLTIVRSLSCSVQCSAFSLSLGAVSGEFLGAKLPQFIGAEGHFLC